MIYPQFVRNGKNSLFDCILSYKSLITFSFILLSISGRLAFLPNLFREYGPRLGVNWHPATGMMEAIA